MGIFEQLPYVDYHNLNLDWILRILKKLDKKVEALSMANDPVFIYVRAGNTEAGTAKEITDVTCNRSPVELNSLVTRGETPVVGSVSMSVDGITMSTTNISYMTGISRATTYIKAVFVKNPGTIPVTYTAVITIAAGGNIASVLQEV